MQNRDENGRYTLGRLAKETEARIRKGEADDDIAVWLQMEEGQGLYNTVRLIQTAKRRIKSAN